MLELFEFSTSRVLDFSFLAFSISLVRRFLMPGFVALLRQNGNYRSAWTGQVVSEIGDHFNNIAVFSLALADDRLGARRQRGDARARRPRRPRRPARRRHAGSSRSPRGDDHVAISFARWSRSAFVLTVHQPKPWLLYALSGLLMFASPFFTSGRAAILPRIASKDELHTANSLTQTTQWTTTTIGTLLGGFSAAHFGYTAAFVLNSLSFAVFGVGDQPAAAA